jgi:hypothetical protein
MLVPQRQVWENVVAWTLALQRQLSALFIVRFHLVFLGHEECPFTMDTSW